MSCSSHLPRGPGIARHLCKLSVLTNPASNLTPQPFPGVYQVKLAPGQAQGRRQPPARGGGRQRSETSKFCQLLAVKSIALRTMALPVQAGGRLAGTCQGWLWDPGWAPAYPLLLPVLGMEKMKNWKYSLSRRIWVKQEESFLNKSGFFQSKCQAWFCCQKQFAEEQNGFWNAKPD